LEVLADFTMNRTAESSERVESRLREHGQMRLDRWKRRETIVGGENGEVEGVLANGYCRPWRL